MKKFAVLTIALCLSAMMLTGCGCMNTNADVTTLPTNGETASPTAATTMPTAPTVTESSSEATVDPTISSGNSAATESTGMIEGAMDDIMGGSADDATQPTGAGRNRGRMIP